MAARGRSSGGSSKSGDGPKISTSTREYTALKGMTPTPVSEGPLAKCLKQIKSVAEDTQGIKDNANKAATAAAATLEAQKRSKLSSASQSKGRTRGYESFEAGKPLNTDGLTEQEAALAAQTRETLDTNYDETKDASEDNASTRRRKRSNFSKLVKGGVALGSVGLLATVASLYGTEIANAGSSAMQMTSNAARTVGIQAAEFAGKQEAVFRDGIGQIQNATQSAIDTLNEVYKTSVDVAQGVGGQVASAGAAAKDAALASTQYVLDKLQNLDLPEGAKYASEYTREQVAEFVKAYMKETVPVVDKKLGNELMTPIAPLRDAPLMAPVPSMEMGSTRRKKKKRLKSVQTV
jgi:hypothetical protein